jgi:hypothetical protein
MKDRDPAQLSYRPLERADLARLAELARTDRAEYFATHRDWAEMYVDRFLGAALCQGAALHYLDPTSGINDFDVYSFYASNPTRRWYAKRIKSVDFGDPKFGVSQIARPGFVGRRVDLMGRELPVSPGADLEASLRRWLRTAGTATALQLKQKAVVLLEPYNRLGTVVWPLNRQAPAA